MREMLNPGHGTISEERIDKKVIKHDSAPGVQAYSTADGCRDIEWMDFRLCWQFPIEECLDR